MDADHIVQFIPNLRAYARSLTRDRQEAEDLLQDTVERAIAKIKLYKEGDLKAWLCTIMRNLFLTAIRKEELQPKRTQEIARRTPTEAQPNQIHRLEVTEVLAAMDKLPEHLQRSLIAVGVEGLDYQELTEREDLPIGTIKSRICRGHAALRKILEPTQVKAQKQSRPTKESRQKKRDQLAKAFWTEELRRSSEGSNGINSKTNKKRYKLISDYRKEELRRASKC